MKTIMKLKSTGQQVFDLPWIAQTKKPWPDGYLRILRPFTNRHEGVKRGHNSQELIVHKSTLLFESA